MKIAIMGYSGSGKTYLADFLSRKLAIPAMHLDAIAFDKNWDSIDPSVVLPLVADFMKQESWIIDGNYSYLYQTERLESADRIIFVNLPRLQCLYRAIRRSGSRKAEGYKNDLNPWFIRFVLFECRRKKRRDAYAEIIRQYRDKTIVLKSQWQINQFMKQISPF